MQSEAARRTCEPSGQGEEPPPHGLGGYDLLSQTEPGRPTVQVIRHHLDRQPGGVGSEAARGEMVQPHAVLEVSNGVLDLGMAAVVRLQFQRLPIPVGDEGVIAVGGEGSQLGTGVGLTRRTMSRTDAASGSLWKGAGGLRHIGGAVYPVGDGRPVRLGYGFDEMAQAGTLADGDGEADLRLATDGDYGMGVEASVSPYRSVMKP